MDNAGRLKGGFSLVEVLIVVCIIALLLAIATLSFSDWVTRYNIESQILMLNGDLLRARYAAMNRNKAHFVVLKNNNYSVVADTHPSPFGDGEITEDDTVVVPEKTFARPINSSSVITFNARGMVPLYQARTICVYSEVNPATDCIIVHTARINTGKIRNQKSTCNSDNCRAK
jgi:prepilin-type N-terminal cleavage/methylation domain-containing protein